MAKMKACLMCSTEFTPPAKSSPAPKTFCSPECVTKWVQRDIPPRPSTISLAGHPMDRKRLDAGTVVEVGLHWMSVDGPQTECGIDVETLHMPTEVTPYHSLVGCRECLEQGGEAALFRSGER